MEANPYQNATAILTREYFSIEIVQIHKPAALDLLGQKSEDRCLTTEEQEALDRFKKKDEEIENMLVLIVQDIDLLKDKASHINMAIERNAKKLEATEAHASKTTAKLATINTKMKDILRKVTLFQLLLIVC